MQEGLHGARGFASAICAASRASQRPPPVRSLRQATNHIEALRYRGGGQPIGTVAACPPPHAVPVDTLGSVDARFGAVCRQGFWPCIVAIGLQGAAPMSAAGGDARPALARPDWPVLLRLPLPVLRATPRRPARAPKPQHGGHMLIASAQRAPRQPACAVCICPSPRCHVLAEDLLLATYGLLIADCD